MPSPFPGMDPYLEEPSQWPGVHQRLITYMADAMQPRIRPRYHVLIGERVYIAEPPQNFYPDVTLLQYPTQRVPADSAVAVAEPDTPTAVGTYLDAAQRSRSSKLSTRTPEPLSLSSRSSARPTKSVQGAKSICGSKSGYSRAALTSSKSTSCGWGSTRWHARKKDCLCPIIIWCVSTAPPRVGPSTVSRCSTACPASAFPCASPTLTLS